MPNKFLLALLLAFTGLSSYGQWQESYFLKASEQDSIKVYADAKYLLATDGFSVIQSGVNTKKTVFDRLHINVFAGASYFTGALLQAYQSQQINQDYFAPSFGRVFVRQGSAFAPLFRAEAEFKFNKHFSIYLGYDNRHYGYGIRSAFRDRLSTPTPYFAYQYSFNENIKYHFQLDYAANAPILGSADIGKFVVSHSVNISNNRWDFFLYETVVWRNKNENGYRGVDPFYLAPLVVFRPTEFALGSSDNVLLGTGVQYKIVDKGRKEWLKVYGQILIDEFLYAEVIAGDGWWANKHALNIGLNYHKITESNAQIKARIEYNHARPYTYTHNDSLQSYSNGTTSLAHPYGANYRDVQLQLSYTKNKWAISNRISFYEKGSRLNTNIGGNILLSSASRDSEYGNKIAQGSSGNSFYIQSQIRYAFKRNLSAYIELQANENGSAIGLGFSYGLKNPFKGVF